MSDETSRVAIVTSVHWEGDARLNRHVEFLRDVGVEAGIISFAHRPRLGALISALRSIGTTRADVVLLPDPELFALGSLLARLTGSQPVIDIHEDYSSVARGRSWIPAFLRPIVALVARWAVRAGRGLAWRVVVAAPELAESGDQLVVNMPAPGSLPIGESTMGKHVVYVGDVTLARGADRMASLLGHLDDRFELVVIGRMDEQTRRSMEVIAERDGTAQRLHLLGRMPHRQSWERAAGAVAGLNLLQDLPAYRQATATKLWEYMAAGIPPVVSDLPGQAEMISSIHPDLVCSDLDAVAHIVIRLAEDQAFRCVVIERGRRLYEKTWAETRPDLAIQSVLEP